MNKLQLYEIFGPPIFKSPILISTPKNRGLTFCDALCLIIIGYVVIKGVSYIILKNQNPIRMPTIISSDELE
jgi:hypothetical protein